MITGAGILQDPVCHSKACGEDADTVRCAKRKRRQTWRDYARDSLRFDCRYVFVKVIDGWLRISVAWGWFGAIGGRGLFKTVTRSPFRL